MKTRKTTLLFFIFTLLTISGYSQVRPPGINGIIAAIDTFRNRMPVEKVYIQTDKPYYASGDTLWFKAYLFDAAFLSAAERSGLLYLELANDTGKVIDRRMVALSYGLGRGNIVLNKEDIPEGSYTLRAYTSWMRNFGEEQVFKKNFYIGSLSSQSWLISSRSISTGDSIRLALQFRNSDRGALGLQDLQLRLMEGKKNLFRSQMQTTADGKLDLHFTLPPKTDAQNITLLAEDAKKGEGGRRSIAVPIPVSINRPENTDLQFMPEGGSMVAGIPATVGFKALGEDGKGTDITGKVYSSSTSSKEVAVFTSLHKGMGSFEITPEAGASYTAKILLPDGKEKSYPLPQVKTSGTALIVNNSLGDSIAVTVSITPDLLTATAPYYLVAQSRGVVCYGAVIRFNGKTVNERKLAKSLFPTGIVRFSLLSTDRTPLNERIIYIDQKDNLDIRINTANSVYKTRDSIALQLEVKDKQGNPVEGSFSLAVTDDNQVKTDSMESTILSNLLLTSDLKGNIEEPGWYFQNKETAAEMDKLMLTQGWINYGWKEVFNSVLPAPKYQAEPEFVVKGRVFNALNKSVAGTSILMFSIRPIVVRDLLTDQQGNFSFSGFPPLDTVKFVIQARNKKDRSFNVGVEVEEFKPPVFKLDTSRFRPWYLNSDTTMLKQIQTKVVQQEELAKLKGENVLESVTITGKKIIKDSYNLNGPGESDQALEEKEIQKLGKTPLLEMLYQKIKGFHIGYFSYPLKANSARTVNYGWDPPKRLSYMIKGKEIRFVIDGMDLENFYEAPMPIRETEPGNDERWARRGGGGLTGFSSSIMPRFGLLDSGVLISLIYDRQNYLNNYLKFLTAEDIKGIEVMYNSQYNSAYNAKFISSNILTQFRSSINNDYAYVEITTYSGNGAMLKKIPGTYFYKSMPFAGTKEFYWPKYTTKDLASFKDLRSTIHWAPDIVTDEKGKAILSFYAADKPGSYTIIAEGSNMNGNIGYRRQKIIIGSQETKVTK